jgi:Tol biopolymer transport system component
VLYESPRMPTIKKSIASIAFVACLIPAIWVVAHAQTPSPSPTPAAAPSASDIFIIEVGSHNGQLKFGAPKKITDVVGYNNQPFFLPDGQGILYTSIRDKQADIYHYDIHSGATTQITNTPESEYSPTLMPDGKSISVIRVEADGTQRLWRFPLAGGTPSLILEKLKPIGYQLWIDDHTLLLFILGKPNTLQIVDTRTEKAETIAENPGRILRRIPHQNKFSFVHKISDKEWVIKAFDLRTRTSASLIDTLPGVEDYAWMPTGLLLMAKDSKLFSVIPLTGKAWSEVADFSNAGLKNITRIAVSAKGDRIAVVARH